MGAPIPPLKKIDVTTHGDPGPAFVVIDGNNQIVGYIASGHWPTPEPRKASFWENLWTTLKESW
jgi:hypothetical protein